VLDELPKLEAALFGKNATEIEEYLLDIWHGKQECLLAGLHSVHVKRWMAHFNSSQLLILNGEDVMKNPGPEYLKLQDFFGVPRNFRLDDWVKHNTTGHFCLHPPQNRSLLYCQDDGRRKARTRKFGNSAIKPSHQVTQMLRLFYQPYNLQLNNILNKDFNWI